MRAAITKTLFIILCFLSLQNLSAQDGIPRKSIITLSVFAPTYSYVPRWNVGYIRNINKRIWLGLEAGYGNYDIRINGFEERYALTKDFQVFEIRPSVYYDLRPSGKLKHLVSAELFFIHHTDTFIRSEYYDNENFKTYKYDFADYKRLKYGFNLNYNLMFNFGSRFALMQTVGFGLRIRDVDFKNVINKVEIDRSGDDEGLGYDFPLNNYYRTDAGVVSALNFNYDMKLLYKF